MMDASVGQPGLSARPEAGEGVSLQQRVSHLAATRIVHTAFDWFSTHSRELSEWQLEMTRIPAPPFGESRRAQWLRGRFEQLGLKDVHIDAVGNVVGIRPGSSPGAEYVLIGAHLDTVFPADVPLHVYREGDRLRGPGISDNAAGLTALLGMAAVLNQAKIKTSSPILFVANVGEEGEGDLRGMRHLFEDDRWKNRIQYSVLLDGGGADSVVTEGLGSRRFLVTVYGPGGHSWTDFGLPNPVTILAKAITLFSKTSVPANPKTTFNVGVISGGTSVNAIPESASMKVDIRSSSPSEIERVERALKNAMDQATAEFRMEARTPDQKPLIHYEMKLIGNRPAAELRTDAHLLRVIQAVDTQLRIRTRMQRASTDANIPLSMDLEAVTLGGGGQGGGAHTLHEWYDPSNRELGLKRILLSVLTLAGVAQ